MTRDEIYDHLAQVYLGKRKEAEPPRKKHFHAWLLINALITLMIFSSVFYGLTAFLTRQSSLRGNVLFALHNGLVRLDYNFDEDFSPVKTLALSAPAIDASRYKSLEFSIRAREQGNPAVVKVVVENHKHETASYYIQGIDYSWQDFRIPLREFKQITDWTSLKNISFVLESWNVEKKEGIILIDNICFSGEKGV
ncbi:MAG TPA: hypothetical protein DE315_06700 [Candidatus Omnitrophica bacterium]|nr:MAG: hypothetical protein A2Y05_04420 [Omnitrophica WOR_2 bacterium GWA2_53_43]HBO96703.1 hypothetical protein [Candidatus Omnitrophota bacterium]HCI45199.1 hypothetical protein [Candidatus Omnitrophota bacterium]